MSNIIIVLTPNGHDAGNVTAYIDAAAVTNSDTFSGLLHECIEEVAGALPVDKKLIIYRVLEYGLRARVTC